MPRESAASRKERAIRLHALLKKNYPDAHCALNYKNSFELLVATILSAQCTDVRVNIVTPALFAKYPTPQKMAEASQEAIEELIRTTGFYRNKAKNILSTSRRLCEIFAGKVPSEMDELLSLAGVARKTANVVLGNAFNKNIGVVVDTHVGRLARRMALTNHQDPVKVEKELMALFPQDEWTMLSHLLIAHGRSLCQARKPQCTTCPLLQDCPQKDVKTFA